MPFSQNHYSEETQSILGQTPSWILSWGITIIFGILIVIMLGCYFIKYPDTIQTSIVITTENPPANVIAKQDGLIDVLYVDDGEHVNTGDIIAVIQSSSNWNDVNRLTEHITAISSNAIDDIINELWIYDIYELGELQNYFLNFQGQVLSYKYYVDANYIDKKKSLLNEQITKNWEYYNKLLIQRDYIEQDIEYSRKAVHRDSIMLSSNVIATSEYEVSIQNLLSKLNSKASFDASISATELQIIQNEQQIIELSIQHQNEINDYTRNIEESLQQLIAQISQWNQQYLLKSPIEGTLSYTEYISEHHNIKVGDRIASIIPEKCTDIVGRIQIPSSRLGKVAIGQPVNVQLNGFPYMEFGVLKGIVNTIYAIPEQVTTANGTYIVYWADVIFPEGMKSSYNIELPMIQQMDGTANIIVEDVRLIERLIMPIISLFKN